MTQSELSEFLDASSALFHPEAEKDKMKGQVIRYSGEKYLSSILTLDDIVAENDEGLTAILDDALFSCQKIPFMAIDSEGSSEKIKGMYHYVLRLYGCLINGQMALVTLIGIQVFFDILIPDGETSDECEEKVSEILSGIVKSFKMEHIKAFLFRGYYREKNHIYEFIQMVLGRERKPSKLSKIIILKLLQMIYTHSTERWLEKTESNSLSGLQ